MRHVFIFAGVLALSAMAFADASLRPE